MPAGAGEGGEPVVTAVTLRPLGEARYAIVRNGADTGAWMFGTYWGWDVERRPRFEHDQPYMRFHRMSQAREWLDSPAGQLWLDSLAAEVPR